MQIAIPLILLWCAHFLVDFMLGMWSVYKTMSFFDLGIAGGIAACAAIIGEGSQLLFGSLSDQGHSKRLILLGLLLAMGNVFLPFTSTYVIVLLFFTITCIGSGAFHPCAASYIGGLTERQKGLFISIFASGGALGMAISQMAFAKTYTYFEGNTLILALPTIALALILIAFGYLKKGERASGASHSMINMEVIKNYFQDRPLKMLFILQVCNQIVFWGTIFLLPDVLVSRGYDADIAFGGGHMAFIIGSAFTMIPSGFLADRFSPRIVIAVSTVLGMIFYFSFLLIPNLSPSYLLLLLLLAGSTIGVVQPLAVALGNELGRKNPGIVSAFTMGLVWCVSESIGPAGTGLVSKLFTEDAPAKSLMIFGSLFPVLLYAASQLPASQKETDLIAE
jgi:MFS transporter, FSR family, fosmidomycin resistance protein